VSGIFMLDTDISSYIIKGNHPAVERRLERLDVMQVCISVITRSELRFGAKRVRGANRLSADVERFLSGIHTLPWDEAAADDCADIRADLERAGTPIGTLDTMIAAHARSTGAVLITNNIKHFRAVKGLAMENWTDKQ
jgi:tRNA(fMet)-specific endonuclease VapC